MLSFPLSISDIGLWLAVTAIMLLATSEIINSSPNLLATILVDGKRLRYAAVGCGLGFAVTLALRIFNPF
jgi:hypothetical protein